MNRKLIVGLVAVAACAALVEWSSCGSSSSTTPTPTQGDTTVSSVTVTGGNAQASPTAGSIGTDTTNVSTGTTAFTITFSAAMDPTTVTATNITLECPVGTSQTLGTIAATDATNTSFTIATTGALPALTECTATFGTGLTDADNHTLSAVTSTFTTGCSSSDSFTNAATIVSGSGCWSFTANDLTGLTIGTNGLDLTREPEPTDVGNDTGAISKIFGSDNISTSVTLTAATGLATGSDNACAFGYAASDGDTIETASRGLHISVAGRAAESGSELRIENFASNETEFVVTPLASISADSPLTITITRADSTLTASYKVGSGETTAIDIPAEWSSDPALALDVGSTPAIGLIISSEFDTTPVSCTFSSFTISGGSATVPNPTGTTGGQD